MPLVFRLMKRDDDGFPKVANTATGLGARVPKDAEAVDGLVQPGSKGMSVNASVADLPMDIAPSRIHPDGLGAKSTRLFQHGSGEFIQAAFAENLELYPDRPGHGLVRPVAAVTLEQFRQDLAATRSSWTDTEL